MGEVALSPFIRYTVDVRPIGYDIRTDWPKLGPCLVIATALIVAIRTARWAAKASPGPLLHDVDVELDREVEFAIRVAGRVLDALVTRKPGLFPQKREPVFTGVEEPLP